MTDHTRIADVLAAWAADTPRRHRHRLRRPPGHLRRAQRERRRSRQGAHRGRDRPRRSRRRARNNPARGIRALLRTVSDRRHMGGTQPPPHDRRAAIRGRRQRTDGAHRYGRVRISALHRRTDPARNGAIGAQTHRHDRRDRRFHPMDQLRRQCRVGGRRRTSGSHRCDRRRGSRVRGVYLRLHRATKGRTATPARATGGAASNGEHLSSPRLLRRCQLPDGPRRRPHRHRPCSGSCRAAKSS